MAAGCRRRTLSVDHAGMHDVQIREECVPRLPSAAARQLRTALAKGESASDRQRSLCDLAVARTQEWDLPHRPTESQVQGRCTCRRRFFQPQAAAQAGLRQGCGCGSRIPVDLSGKSILLRPTSRYNQFGEATNDTEFPLAKLERNDRNTRTHKPGHGHGCRK